MRLIHFGVVTFVSAALLTGCGLREPKVSEEKVTLTKRLTVTGRKEGVERFAKLQRSLKPPVQVSAMKSLGGDRATLLVILPNEQTNEELVNRTREALAAGLSYKYEEVQTTLGSNMKS